MKKMKKTEKIVLKAVNIWSKLLIKILFLCLIGLAMWMENSIYPLYYLLIFPFIFND